MANEVTSRQSKFALTCVSLALAPPLAILSFACWKAAGTHPENLLSLFQVMGGVVFGLLAFQLFGTAIWSLRVDLHEYEHTIGWSSRQDERKFAHYMRKIGQDDRGMKEDIKDANRQKFEEWRADR